VVVDCMVQFHIPSFNIPFYPGKSGQFEKEATQTLEDKNKSECVEKKNMPSPLRRSGRTGSYSSTSHSDSKSSASLNSNPKPKKEKSMRQLTFEAKEAKENEEQDLGTPQVKVKRMTARIFRSLFELPKEGNILRCLVSFLFGQFCFP